MQHEVDFLLSRLGYRISHNTLKILSCISVKQNITFQWAILLNWFPPPGLQPKVDGADRVPLRKKSSELDEDLAFGLPQDFLDEKSEGFRDFADLHREVRQGIYGSQNKISAIPPRDDNILKPIASYHGPSVSLLVSLFNHLGI